MRRAPCRGRDQLLLQLRVPEAPLPRVHLLAPALPPAERHLPADRLAQERDPQLLQEVPGREGVAAGGEREAGHPLAGEPERGAAGGRLTISHTHTLGHPGHKEEQGEDLPADNAFLRQRGGLLHQEDKRFKDQPRRVQPRGPEHQAS